MIVLTFTNFSMLHVLPILWLLFTASMTAKNVLAHQENRSWLFPTAATIRTLTTSTTRTFPVPYVVKLPSPLSSLQRLQRLRGGGGGSSSSTGIATSTATSSSRVQPKPSPEGTVDATSQVINLIKTIIGAGVLGIPAGMTASFAATSSSSSVLGRSLSLLIIIGLLAANGFNNIGQICRSTNSFSYAQAWNRTVSETTTILPNVACVMVTFCTLVTYSMVLSDTIPSLLRPIIVHQPLEMLKRALPHVTRMNVLLLLSTFILLPLCLLQSLSALAPFSFVGICGMIYTAVIMTVRYLDKSYSTTGRFIATIEPKL
jgi:Transmembrane amino acid transporter protein